jgi:hypothetical protein
MYKTAKKIWSQVRFKTKFSSIHIAATKIINICNIDFVQLVHYAQFKNK